MQKTFTQLLIVFFILFQLPLATAYAEIASASKPNIIFIMADDLGKDLLSVYGAKPVIKMPNLERLAKEGVVFKNAYATSLCVSTRAQLISGRYSLNTGAYANKYSFTGGFHKEDLKDDQQESLGRMTGFYNYIKNSTPEPGGLKWLYSGISPYNPVFSVLDPQHTPSFALPLKYAGYTTAIIGKWHIGNYVRQPRVFRLFGFDRWMISSFHQNANAFTDKGFIATDGFLPEKMADFAIDFIKENKDTPFFIYYPMNLIHGFHVATPLNPKAKTKKEKMISMVEYVDFTLGRLIKTLEELNLKNRTIIFFSGDNGSDNKVTFSEEFSTNNSPNNMSDLLQQQESGKGTAFESGVNVPLIISGGPIVRRGETDALTDFTDILPTLAAFAGVSATRERRHNDNDYRGIADLYVQVAGEYKGDGYSIVPFLIGKADDTPRDWIMSLDSSITFRYLEHIVIRDKRFKLWARVERELFHSDKLYDLHNDPSEMNNLYDSKNPTVVAAQLKLEQILGNLPKPSMIEVQSDPIDWDYGMLAHWPMDEPNLLTNMLSDTEGGYDAENDDKIIFAAGKFDEAIEADRVYTPHSQGLFYSSIKGDNGRFFGPLGYKGRKGTHKSMTNKLTRIINEIFREKFLSAMTVSGWVRTQKPEQNIYLLKQPYINKESHLISFAMTKDATIKFELTTDGELRKLESGIIDGRLWGEWMHIAATWDGEDGCGKAALYVNGKSISEGCLGESLSADGTDDLLLGGFTQSSMPNIAKALVDDIAIWRQPLMPMQVEALYSLGNRFSYNASEVDTLFNTPAENGTTQISNQMWQRIPLDDTADTNHLIIRELPDAIEVQFGEVMAIRRDNI